MIYKFSVVQFSDPPSPRTPKYVTVPTSWLGVQSQGIYKQVKVAYPIEDPELTKKRVKNEEQVLRKWKTYMATVEFETNNYTDAIIRIHVLDAVDMGRASLASSPPVYNNGLPLRNYAAILENGCQPFKSEGSETTPSPRKEALKNFSNNLPESKEVLRKKKEPQKSPSQKPPPKAHLKSLRKPMSSNLKERFKTLFGSDESLESLRKSFISYKKSQKINLESPNSVENVKKITNNVKQNSTNAKKSARKKTNAKPSLKSKLDDKARDTIINQITYKSMPSLDGQVDEHESTLPLKHQENDNAYKLHISDEVLRLTDGIHNNPSSSVSEKMSLKDKINNNGFTITTNPEIKKYDHTSSSSLKHQTGNNTSMYSLEIAKTDDEPNANMPTREISKADGESTLSLKIETKNKDSRLKPGMGEDDQVSSSLPIHRTENDASIASLETKNDDVSNAPMSSLGIEKEDDTPKLRLIEEIKSNLLSHNTSITAVQTSKADNESTLSLINEIINNDSTLKTDVKENEASSSSSKHQTENNVSQIKKKDGACSLPLIDQIKHNMSVTVSEISKDDSTLPAKNKDNQKQPTTSKSTLELQSQEENCKQSYEVLMKDKSSQAAIEMKATTKKDGETVEKETTNKSCALVSPTNDHHPPKFISVRSDDYLFGTKEDQILSTKVSEPQRKSQKAKQGKTAAQHTVTLPDKNRSKPPMTSNLMPVTAVEQSKQKESDISKLPATSQIQNQYLISVSMADRSIVVESTATESTTNQIQEAVPCNYDQAANTQSSAQNLLDIANHPVVPLMQGQCIVPRHLEVNTEMSSVPSGSTCVIQETAKTNAQTALNPQRRSPKPVRVSKEKQPRTAVTTTENVLQRQISLNNGTNSGGILLDQNNCNNASRVTHQIYQDPYSSYYGNAPSSSNTSSGVPLDIRTNIMTSQFPMTQQNASYSLPLQKHPQYSYYQNRSNLLNKQNEKLLPTRAVANQFYLLNRELLTMMPDAQRLEKQKTVTTTSAQQKVTSSSSPQSSQHSPIYGNSPHETQSPIRRQSFDPQIHQGNPSNVQSHGSCVNTSPDHLGYEISRLQDMIDFLSPENHIPSTVQNANHMLQLRTYPQNSYHQNTMKSTSAQQKVTSSSSPQTTQHSPIYENGRQNTQTHIRRQSSDTQIPQANSFKAQPYDLYSNTKPNHLNYSNNFSQSQEMQTGRSSKTHIPTTVQNSNHMLQSRTNPQNSCFSNIVTPTSAQRNVISSCKPHNRQHLPIYENGCQNTQTHNRCQNSDTQIPQVNSFNAQSYGLYSSTSPAYSSHSYQFSRPQEMQVSSKNHIPTTVQNANHVLQTRTHSHNSCCSKTVTSTSIQQKVISSSSPRNSQHSPIYGNCSHETQSPIRRPSSLSQIPQCNPPNAQSHGPYSNTNPDHSSYSYLSRPQENHISEQTPDTTSDHVNSIVDLPATSTSPTAKNDLDYIFAAKLTDLANERATIHKIHPAMNEVKNLTVSGVNLRELNSSKSDLTIDLTIADNNQSSKDTKFKKASIDSIQPLFDDTMRSLNRYAMNAQIQSAEVSETLLEAQKLEANLSNTANPLNIVKDNILRQNLRILKENVMDSFKQFAKTMEYLSVIEDCDLKDLGGTKRKYEDDDDTFFVVPNKMQKS